MTNSTCHLYLHVPTSSTQINTDGRTDVTEKMVEVVDTLSVVTARAMAIIAGVGL